MFSESGYNVSETSLGIATLSKHDYNVRERAHEVPMPSESGDVVMELVLGVPMYTRRRPYYQGNSARSADVLRMY